MDDERNDCSLVALLEVNNVNQLASGDVIWVKTKINGHILKMELDTDTTISTLTLQKYKETFPNTPLVNTTAILKTYLGEKIKLEGKLLVHVEQNNQIKDLTLYVVKTQGSTIGYTKWNSTGSGFVLFKKRNYHKAPRRT